MVAVSGGSDSLALLDILRRKNEYTLIAAHVNYNYRESASRDEFIVKKYCLFIRRLPTFSYSPHLSFLPTRILRKRELTTTEKSRL